ncbi:MAG: hypothetical protein ACREVW_10465 [Burkholderiales bacterium]
MDGEHLNYHHQHCLLGTLATGEGVPLTHADRRRHLYLIGKTGTGKSTLLFNLMMADLEIGRGFALLDPHGDLAQAVADAVLTCGRQIAATSPSMPMSSKTSPPTASPRS